MHGIVLCSGENALQVNAEVVVETLVFGVYEGFPEHGVYVFVLHGSPVLVEKLANHDSIGTVNLGSLIGDRLLYHCHSG